ncbi:hypothetical protein [Jannaschia seohaensis]|uniref:DUF2726 domain-containing protein n=1 Tax=Jannaschia seohaensis TaxID=475081 RepID=A0A2Y9AYD8_9RHOB|nr:hypothetical protein [Jannaschia seohaensis]PWJ16989.1 hypothetical protein BCF38_107102 [Jannaschia seohaensis]SSA48298.1 hypothetical protein SAMN05421539_107102 [Jannaschia seohaensis]
MSLERILSRLAGAQPVAIEGPASALSHSDLRGSGSWANEWSGAERAVQRAKTLALPAKARRAVTELEGEHGRVSVRPLMAPRMAKLYERLFDKMEVEAPTCTLHAGVAMSVFLKAERRSDGSDRLADLSVDLLIADDQGTPLVVLLADDPKRPQRQIRRVDALLDAGLPHVEIPARPSLSAIWPEIVPHIVRH